MRASSRTSPGGVTLIELLIGIAIVAILLALVGPSMRDLIDMQRLRAVNAELVTDVQFARSEAVSRHDHVYVTFGSSPALSCYAIYTCTSNIASNCDCQCATTPATCNGFSTEVRTVRADNLRGISIDPEQPNTQLKFDRDTGSMSWRYFNPMAGGGVGAGDAFATTELVRLHHKLRTNISVPGRPSVCSPFGSVSGVPTC